MKMKRVKDRQLTELLELNGKLIELGNDLVASIEKYGKFPGSYGESPHMSIAIANWNRELRANYEEIK